jgi:rhodanese-related sulfurtransferase
MIEAKAFAETINTTQNPQIIDVRTPEEFMEGHIDDATNVNWLGDHFVSDAEKLDKTKPIFVYCKSGARSKKATEKLEELGFKNIYELEGG